MKHPSIIILHGWGLDGKTFLPLLVQLKEQGYEVYAPDMPGFGHEPAPTTVWGLSDYARFVKAFIEKYRLIRPVIIGHSFGGRVALQFSHLYPQLTRAVILTGTPGFSPVSRGKVLLFRVIAKIGVTIFMIPFLSSIKDAARILLYYVAGVKDFYKANPIMRQIFKKVIIQPLDTFMQELKLPTLLIWGEYDGIVPKAIAEKMKNTIHNAKLVIIENEDHRVPYKNPEKFSYHVTTFVKSL